MKNLYFDDHLLAPLLRTQSWQLVSSLVADCGCRQSPRHRRWMSDHEHAHSYTEVMIALAGKTVYGVDQRIYPCCPGSVFVIDPDVPHDITYPSWTPSLTHLWISFIQNKAMARLMTSRHGRPRVRSNIRCLLDLRDTSLWQQGVSAVFTPGLPTELIRLRLVAALADIVAELAEDGYRETATDQLHLFQQRKVEIICRHIQETGGATAQIDHLAQIAGYSKFHFMRLFREHTGQTIHDYIDQSRLCKVEVLRTQGLAFKEISAELGFSCPAAFSRWYRKFRK